MLDTHGLPESHGPYGHGSDPAFADAGHTGPASGEGTGVGVGGRTDANLMERLVYGTVECGHGMLCSSFRTSRPRPWAGLEVGWPAYDASRKQTERRAGIGVRCGLGCQAWTAP